MISVYYIGAFLTALAYLAYAFYIKSRLGLDMSPDGGYYLQLGRGEAVPVPYCLRPIVPLTQLFITSLEPDAHHYNTTEG